jgi:hypothetical protein
MAIDTSRIIEIEASPNKLLGLVGMGVAMTAVSAAIAFALLPGVGPFDQIWGYAGLVFFGAATVVALWRLATMRGPVVTITPSGIRDIRIAAELVPWSGITRISTWAYAGQKVMVLKVDPACESGLTLSATARWTRGANRALGADGLAITAQGLKIDYQTLFDTSMAYAQASKTCPHSAACA